MPRKIVSQDPVVVPARGEKTFDDIRMTMFRAHFDGARTNLKVQMSPYDYETDELMDSTDHYHMRVENLEAQMVVTPKFERAWNDINDVMGLAYDFYRLKEKVAQAIANGEDATALIAARNAALATLRAPV